MSDFAKNLEQRRKALGLSAERLAALAGVSANTVREIERGHAPKVSTQLKIEQALRDAVLTATNDSTSQYQQMVIEVAELREAVATMREQMTRLAEALDRASRPGPQPQP